MLLYFLVIIWACLCMYGEAFLPTHALMKTEVDIPHVFPLFFFLCLYLPSFLKFL